MAIKRYTAIADTTVTNAYKNNLINRGTGSNMGLSDSLEVFSLFGQASGTNGYSQELSRILLKFPVEDLQTDRTNSDIPSSGSVSFYLRLFNAEHGETLPRNAIVNVVPVTKEWEEGFGLDMDSYSDEVKGGTGSTWIDARQGTQWSSVGGDYDFDSSTYYTYEFYRGNEDLEIDITRLVEDWMAGSRNNYGIGVHLTSSQEAYFSSSLGSNSGSVIHNVSGAQTSYYTKKFYARDSEYYYKRPILEARWDSSRQDDRGQVYFSSSLMTAEDNLNTLYLYNFVRGRLRNIPSITDGVIHMSLYSGSLSGSDVWVPSGSKLLLPVGGGVVANLDTNVTGGIVETGIYTASFAVTSSTPALERIFDVWHLNDTQFYTASFAPKKLPTYSHSPQSRWYIAPTNLKSEYSKQEKPRIRVYTRPRDWQPNIYTQVVSEPELEVIPSASYEIFRISDGLKVIPFGTGSLRHTYLSYDISGNYLDLDMSQLEEDFGYGIRFSFYDDDRNSWDVQQNEYKFRVKG